MALSWTKTATVLCASVISVTALANPPARRLSQLRPLWAGPAAELASQANNSFLLDKQIGPRAELFRKGDVLAEFFDERFLDQREAREFEQKYRDINRVYEMRRSYGIAQLNDELCHIDDVRKLGQEVVDRVGQRQGQHATDGTMRLVDRHEPTRVLKKPVALFGVLAGVYSGIPFDLTLLEGTKLTARTDMPAQAGQFSLDTPLLNSSVSYIAGDSRPNPLSGVPVLKKIDPINRDEKVRVSFSRGLPFWNLSSQLAYGSTSSNVMGILTKPLTPNLVCEVATVRPMDADKAANAEERIKLNYEFHF